MVEEAEKIFYPRTGKIFKEERAADWVFGIKALCDLYKALKVYAAAPGKPAEGE